MSFFVYNTAHKQCCKSFALFFLLYVGNLSALTYLFSHGFAARAKQFCNYVKEYENRRGKVKKNNFYIIDGCVKSFNYPDAAHKPFVNIFKTCLGQEKDLIALRRAYHEIHDDEIILVGVSRGASAAATFMGTDKPERVKAVILISPFDHLINVFKSTRLSQFLYRVLKKCSCFNENGKHPIDWLCKKEKNVPVIFVCSKTDKTVPCQSTISLYKSLLDAGHTNIYLLCLPEGKHAKLLKSKYAGVFQNVVHAFYDKYNFPCNEKFAAIGKRKLQSCAPTVRENKLLLCQAAQGDSCESHTSPSLNGSHSLHDAKNKESLVDLAASFITILAYLKSSFGAK